MELQLKNGAMPPHIGANRFAAEFVPFGETSVTDDVDTVSYSVLSGTLCLISELAEVAGCQGSNLGVESFCQTAIG